MHKKIEIQTNHLIPARRPDLALINNKKRTSRIAVSTDHRVEIKKATRDKYLDLAREF